MKKLMVVIFGVAIVAVAIFMVATICSNQNSEPSFEAFDGAVINPEIFQTGVTREEVHREIRMRPTDMQTIETQPIYFTVAWFDNNDVLELAAEGASWGTTEWTIFYQSENKIFITEWRDGIEFHRNMQPLDIVGMFGFDIYFLPSTHERNHPVSDGNKGTSVARYVLNDNSMLYFRFWSAVAQTGLDGVYRQIDGEFIRVF